jgi:hypothetical protein
MKETTEPKRNIELFKTSILNIVISFKNEYPKGIINKRDIILSDILLNVFIPK